MNVRTKRLAAAQVVVCLGCCCGNTSKGEPSVPSEWLKAEWKKHKLHAFIHLTVSGCLGPCDIANVVLVTTPFEQIWLGGITSQETYEALLSWALHCRSERKLLPLPAECVRFVFERYCDKQEQRAALITDSVFIE